MNNPYPKDFTPQCKHLAWLSNHLDGWQFGEQGLIEAILEALRLDDGRCVEYGAGDGVLLPLTIERLWKQRPEDCDMIEIDSQRREKLREVFTASWIYETIDWSDYSRDCIDIVVIDIDGKDSVVMREMLNAGVRPTLLVVEHMDRHFPIATSIPDVIPEWMLGLQLKSGHAIQDTAETLHAMAAEHGYERIGYNRCNSFFVVRERYADLFC